MLSRDLDVVIERYHQALNAFLNGNPLPMGALYSQRDDVTLATPFGPPVRGWDQVAETMTRAAANYGEGEAMGFDRVSEFATADLGYTVEIERYRSKVGGDADLTPIAIRVTTIFRREENEWRVIHRHADPTVSARPAVSVVQQPLRGFLEPSGSNPN
jgi:ketosteroid isomerase-like protein